MIVRFFDPTMQAALEEAIEEAGGQIYEAAVVEETWGGGNHDHGWIAAAA